MSSHALPYSAGELVRHYARSRGSIRSRLLAPLFRLMPASVLDVTARQVVMVMETLARDATRTALMFEALTERVLTQGESDQIDEDDSLYASLREMELRVRANGQRIETTWRALASPDGSRRATIRAAALRASAAAEALADAVRDLRGAIQAHDANITTLRRARRPANTAQEIATQLDADTHAQ